jgi:hypothetical protein
MLRAWASIVQYGSGSRRGGRNGEVNEFIIVRVHQTSGYRRKETLSAYSVEAVDEEAMTAFIQARTCRRRALGAPFPINESRCSCAKRNLTSQRASSSS